MVSSGLAAYLREVIQTESCPDCGASEDEPCTKIGPGAGHGEVMTYVHDGRSFHYHMTVLAELAGSENTF